MKSHIVSSLRQKTPTRRRLLQALGFACLAASAALPARAQTAYTWDGGTGNWSNGSMWGPGNSPNSASADVYVDGGKTTVASVVAVDGNFTVGRLTVDVGDTVNINDNQSLTVTAGSFTGSGSVIDNGTINVASGGNDGTALVFTTTGSLSGTGTLNLMNNAFVYANSGDLLTVGAGFTVTGSGQLGNGSTTFTNNGTVNANISGATLNLRPGGGNATFTNNGLAEATKGGALNLDGENAATFTGGTFQAFDTSTLNLVNSATVKGATLTTAGTGVINAFNGTTLTNVTSGGKLNVPDNNSATLVGTFTFTNNSTTTIASGGNNSTSLILSGPVTLTGTGTVSMTNNAFLYAANSGDRLTIGAGVTVQGQGEVGNGSTTFTNNGTVNSNVNTIDLRPGGTAATGADFTNAGAGFAEATNGGTLNLNGANGGTFVGGTFEALAGSTINAFNSATVSNAILTTAGTTGVVNVGGNATLNNVTNNGTLNVPDNNAAFLSGTFTNNGTTTIASGGNNSTDLILSGPVTLAGTGTVNLTNNAYLYGSGGSLLTIGAGVTIQGQGQVGLGSTTFVNNGLVNANVSGAILNLRPSAGSAAFTNNTVAEATNGGSLDLDGQNTATFTGGTFQALTGSTLNIFNGATVSNATLATAGSGVVNISGSATLNNVTSNAAVFVPDNNLAYLSGTYTLANNSVTTVNSLGNNSTYLLLTGPVTLAGTGTVNLTNNAYLYGSGGSLLTIGAGVTIQGQGQVGLGSTTFVNNGLVNANVSGAILNLRPSAGSAAFTNNTVAEATNGGSLDLDGQNTATFTGGTFQALTGSTLNIFNGATVSNATLATAGSGVVNISGSATLNNVTSNAAVFVPDNNLAYLSGTYTLANNSVTTVNSLGNNSTYLLLTGPVTLAGTGTVNLTNNAYLYGSGGSLLTIGAGVTVQGQGQLGFGVTTFVNNGLVDANVSGNTLDVRPSAGTVGFTNAATGLAEATGGGTLHLEGSNGNFTNNGTFAAVSGGTGGGSTLAVDAGHLTNFAGTTLTGGTYNVISTNTAATSTLTFGGGTITTNAANVTLSGANTVFTEIGGLAANQGSFTVANGRNFTTVGALANTGTLVSAGGSTLTVSGAFTQSTAGTIAGNGAYTDASGFTIAGNVNPGGTVSTTTGAFTGGPGTTTFNSGSTAATDTTFTVDAQFHFELGTTTGTNDHLTVNGLLNLNGTLNVTALAGFGTGTYDLIDYPIADAAYLLAHDTLKLGSLPAGYTYVLVNTVAGQVDLAVVQNAVPEPGTWASVLGGATLLLSVQYFRRRTRHGG